MLEVLGEGEIVHLVFKVRKPGLIPALITELSSYVEYANSLELLAQ
jgi:hypothetical protein